MVTKEELKNLDLQIAELKRKIVELYDKLVEIETRRIARKKKEVEEEKKVSEEETESESLRKKIGRLLRKALKKQRALEKMTHSQRVKELAAKARNFTMMLYDAKQAETEDQKRLRDLIALIVAQEEMEYAEEEEKMKVMKEMHGYLIRIQTDNLETLTPEQNENNIRLWAQFHACLRKLGLIDENMMLNTEQIKRLRQEAMPIITKKKDLDKKIEAWEDWLRNLEEEERKDIGEEEKQQAA